MLPNGKFDYEANENNAKIYKNKYTSNLERKFLQIALRSPDPVQDISKRLRLHNLRLLNFTHENLS